MDTSEIKKTIKQEQAMQILSDSTITRVLLYGGSRSGKTFILVWAIVMRAIIYPNSRHLIARKTNGSIWRSIGLDTLPTVLKLLGVECKINSTERYWTLPNGSEIWLSGLDDKDRVEKILGMEFATIYFNEVSQLSYQAYELVFTRLAQRIEGCVNKLYFDCNPPSKAHWIFLLFIKLQIPTQKINVKNPETYASMQMNPVDNLENIATDYLDSLDSLSLSAQKRFKDGNFSDASEGDLWSEKLLDDTRVLESFEMKFKRVALGIDPSGSDGKNLDGAETDPDDIGIVAVGLGEDDHLYVLEDATVNLSPNEWAKKAIKTYQNRCGDIIVCESNYGGAMCESVIRNVTDDRTIRIKLSRSQRSKYVRAEPILALYEQGLAHHVGVFDKLEEEMTTYKAGSRSPNRMDALVFACTELGQIVPMAVQKTVKGLF